MKRLDDFVENVLRQSGWFSGRQVDSSVSEWKSQLKATDNLEMFPKAEEVLLEFGGIKVERKKDFSKQSFEINPSLAVYEGDRFEEYASLLKVKIYPLGEGFSGHCFLGVVEDGRIVWIMDAGIFLMGDNFGEALTKMILGQHPEPIKI